VSLASLKGRPLLFDFIYTRCPGPCVTLTAQMKAVARRLGESLGRTVGFVSISVDPEHDRPAQLLSFARERGANLSGWHRAAGSARAASAAPFPEGRTGLRARAREGLSRSRLQLRAPCIRSPCAKRGVSRCEANSALEHPRGVVVVLR